MDIKDLKIGDHVFGMIKAAPREMIVTRIMKSRIEVSYWVPSGSCFRDGTISAESVTPTGDRFMKNAARRVKGTRKLVWLPKGTTITAEGVKIGGKSIVPAEAPEPTPEPVEVKEDTTENAPEPTESAAPQKLAHTDELPEVVRRNLPAGVERVLAEIFRIRKTKKDSGRFHYHAPSGFVYVTDPKPMTAKTLNRAVELGWLSDETGTYSIEDCADGVDVIRFFRPGDRVAEENLQSCRDEANPKRKEANMAAKKTASKKTASKTKSNGNGRTRTRKVADYSRMKQGDFFGDAGNFKPGRDATLKSLLLKVGRGEASPAEKKLAKSLDKHPKTQSDAFRALYAAI